MQDKLKVIAIQTPRFKLRFPNANRNLPQSLKATQQAVINVKAEIAFKPDRAEVYELLDQKGSFEELKKVSEAVDKHKNNIVMVASQVAAMQRIVADPTRSIGPEKIQREFLSKATKKMSEVILSPRGLPDERKSQSIAKSRTQTPRRTLRLRISDTLHR